MLPPVLFSFVASILVPSLAGQVQLGSSHHGQDRGPVILSGEAFAEWNLGKLPNPNNTDHLVFETVHSLLQHWPNTRMRNGKRSAYLSFSRICIHLQAITSYRESYQKERFSITVSTTRSYHRVQVGSLQILNTRIFSAWIDSMAISNKRAGISHSQPLGPSKSYILMEAVP